ncbi:odorant receptor 46a-like isoform X1 [Tenebrio molitor]|uniref:odorant receptor 46a-like isoform X1 n=1 Tax=Tenebrio molitor TaxID=7067 RepID=UPI0036247750
MSVHSRLIYQSSFNNSAVPVTMTKFDWKSTIRTNLLMLRLTGLWPESDDGYKLDLYTFYAICAKVLNDVNNFFQTCYIFEIYTDLQALASTFFVLGTDWLASIKVYYFMRKIKTIKRLLKELESEEFQPRSEHQKISLEPTLKSWKVIYAAFWIVTVPALSSVSIFPIIDGSARHHRLPFWAWYPYDTTTSPNYEVTYFYQVVGIWFLAICNINMDTLMAALMMYTVTQCDILCNNLRNIKSGDRSKQIIECVQHHKKILSFAQSSNKVFNEMVLGQFFTTSASLALGMFEFTLVQPLSSEGIWVTMYLSSMTVQIFLYCWFGNLVEDRSSQIPYSAFESDWTGIPIEAKKNLLIFIMRSQKPIKMSAINLFSLSLSTFTTILRTSWSYFAVLRQVNAQD